MSKAHEIREKQARSTMRSAALAAARALDESRLTRWEVDVEELSREEAMDLACELEELLELIAESARALDDDAKLVLVEIQAAASEAAR